MVRNWISRSRDINIFKAFDILLNCCSESLYQISSVAAAYKRNPLCNPQQYWILTYLKIFYQCISEHELFLFQFAFLYFLLRLNIYQEFLWMLFSTVYECAFSIFPLGCYTFYWLVESSLYIKVISLLYNANFCSRLSFTLQFLLSFSVLKWVYWFLVIIFKYVT